MAEEFVPFPHFSTDAIHEGQEPEQWSSRALIPLISLSTTFKQEEPGKIKEFEYSRGGNPTRNLTEKCIAKLENGKHCLLYSSGLAATTAITQMLKAGEHVVAMNDLYGGTNRFFRRIASVSQIETLFVDMTNLENLKNAIKPTTRMVWVETPTNPMMQVVDIAAVCKIAHAHSNVFVVTDNTFSTPYFQRPLDLGSDIVLHSLTKYMNGHGDVVMGAVVTSDNALEEKLRFIQYAAGAIPSPFDCYLLNRGLKTLALRMAQHQKNGLAVAKHLQTHDMIEEVRHPGLESHPQYEVAKRQMRGFSGMITCYLKGGLTESRAFLSSLKVFTLAESLGGFESLAEHPAIMTHASVPPEQRKELGIVDNLVRLSVGLEDVDDLIADLDRALLAAKNAATAPNGKAANGN